VGWIGFVFSPLAQEHEGAKDEAFGNWKNTPQGLKPWFYGLFAARL